MTQKRNKIFKRVLTDSKMSHIIKTQQHDSKMGQQGS